MCVHVVSAGFGNCPHHRHFSDRFGRVFGDRRISSSLWPASLPDLTPSDFHVWGDLKDKVNRTNSNTKKELKENIQREILKVPQENHLRVNFNLFKLYAHTGTCF
jgi:hypothetical protein